MPSHLCVVSAGANKKKKLKKGEKEPCWEVCGSESGNRLQKVIIIKIVS